MRLEKLRIRLCFRVQRFSQGLGCRVGSVQRTSAASESTPENAREIDRD